MVAELLNEAAEAVTRAEWITKCHAEYLQLRKDAVGALEKLSPDLKKTAGERAKADQSIKDADKNVAERRYPAAKTALAFATSNCEAAELKQRIQANDVPSKNDLKKLADRPGGLALLDDLIKGVSDELPREFVGNALEVRFDLQLLMYTKEGEGVDAPEGEHRSDMGKKGRSLRKIYKLMLACPDSNTKDNPSLQKVKRYGGESSAAAGIFRSREAMISLRCGRVKDFKKETFGLDESEEDCKPRHQPQLFDSTVYHEVGHSVDDKLNFMKTRLGKGRTDFGGWEDYGANVMPVAEAAAASFEVPVKYVAELLTDADPDDPDAGEVPSEIWQLRLANVKEWCQYVRTDKNPWSDSEGSAGLALGSPKRVYQESYPNRWVSYLLDARKKGISTYQFRAPGEWFAELYAAYFSGSLKEKHPAMSWLTKNFPKSKV